MTALSFQIFRRVAPAAFLVAGLAAASGIVSQAAAQQPMADKKMKPGALVEALQRGGLIVYIRHTRTETDYADQVKAKMGKCSTQRTLSEAGWRDARRIGGAFERLNIPVSTVTSSQYCRAWQTAALAFGRYAKSADLNFAPAEKYTKAQTASMRRRLLPRLVRKPAQGWNTVLVGHDDPFEAATGIYPKPMGVAYVIRPLGDGRFEILGSIGPDAWPAR